MDYALLALLMVVNAAISAFNAWSVGKVWPERRAAPWHQKLVIWSSATMSACGFTWVYLMVLALVAASLRHATWLAGIPKLKFLTELPPSFIPAMLDLGYLIIIVPILGSGLVLMVQSWAVFYRRRTFGNGAVAGWNTMADIYNFVTAVQAVPQALRSVIDFFENLGDNDEADGIGGLIIALVVTALCGGIFTTTAIIRWSARGHVAAIQRRYRPAFAS